MAPSRAASTPIHTPVPRRAAGTITALTMLASALGVAAGLQLAEAAPAVIEGVVFLDANGDGRRSDAEVGVSDVQVVVIDGHGSRSAPATTSADGGYRIDFDGGAGGELDDGPYRVEFSGWPDDLRAAPLGPDNGSSVQFVAGASTASFGLEVAGEERRIGDRVWLDLDGDGIQDPGEPGLDGVTVTAVDADGAELASVRTGEGSGPAGTWEATVPADRDVLVRVDATTATGLPFGLAAEALRPTTPFTGDARLDSDLGPTGDIRVAPDGGAVASSLDAGFTVDLAAGLAVEKIAAATWNLAHTPIDYTVVVANAGPGEVLAVTVDDALAPPCARGPFDLAAGAVERWTCTSTPVDGATGESGLVVATGEWRHPFTEEMVSVRAEGTASARVVAPALDLAVEWAAGSDGDGPTRIFSVGNAGDVDLDLGTPARLFDEACASFVDAAPHPTAGPAHNVGDLDADGILDVEADGADGDDALGREVWRFACVPDDAIGDRSSVATTTLTVLGTPVAPDGGPTGLPDVSRQLDASVVPPAPPTPDATAAPARASIGDRIWHDDDGDGIQGDAEPGVGGVVVDLVMEHGATHSSIVSADDGSFGFADLDPGVYRLRVALPVGWRSAPAHAGVDDGRDSDLGADGLTAWTTLDPGEHDDRVDIGLHGPTTIGGRAWLDGDVDGVQDTGEDGLAGVSVRLFDADGRRLAETTSDDTGAYAFTEVRPGRHQIGFVVPAGMAVTTADAGDADDLDSDLDPATGRTPVIDVLAGRHDTTWAAGFHVPTVVLSSPEEHSRRAAGPVSPRLAVTGRSVYLLVWLAVLLVGVGGSLRIVADRMRRPLAPAS